MANSCWNSFSFFGNKKVQTKAVDWITQLNAFKATDEDPDRMHAVYEVFYPNTPREKIELGSKWVYPDTDVCGQSRLGLFSAWGPPEELQNHLLLALYGVDPLVVVRNAYSVEFQQFGFRYVLANSAGTILEESAVVDKDDLEIEDIDPSDLSDELAFHLKEIEIDTLKAMIVDMPEHAKNLQLALKKLNR